MASQLVDPHPQAKIFRNEGILHGYSEMEIIFDGKIATGRFVSSSSSINSPTDNVNYVAHISLSSASSLSSSSSSSSARSAQYSLSGGPIPPNVGSSQTSTAPKRKRSPNADVIEVLKDIQAQTANGNGLRRALQVFNDNEICKKFSLTERLTIKSALSKLGNAEIFLSCTGEEIGEFVQTLLNASVTRS